MIEPNAKISGPHIKGPIVSPIKVNKYLKNKFLMHILSESPDLWVYLFIKTQTIPVSLVLIYIKWKKLFFENQHVQQNLYLHT